jgi:hypothetical protein
MAERGTGDARVPLAALRTRVMGIFYVLPGVATALTARAGQPQATFLDHLRGRQYAALRAGGGMLYCRSSLSAS